MFTFLEYITDELTTILAESKGGAEAGKLEVLCRKDV